MAGADSDRLAVAELLGRCLQPQVVGEPEIRFVKIGILAAAVSGVTGLRFLHADPPLAPPGGGLNLMRRARGHVSSRREASMAVVLVHY